MSPDGRDELALLRVGGLYTTLDDLAFPPEGTKLRFGVDQALRSGAGFGGGLQAVTPGSCAWRPGGTAAATRR